ncbi:MAG: Crp/Fnr family transcriptional regulator [Bacteroidia bacterium]|nr:Crp/Fnr family transcriptional regulator [Bacteroidia bacterium]
MKIVNLLSILRKVTIKSVPKGEILIHPGTSTKDIFFIRKGMVRSYYANGIEEEITFQLYPEFHMVVNIHAMLFDEPSQFYYQTLEPSKVYTIDYNSFMEMASKDPELFEMNHRFIGKKAMKLAFKRVESFVFLSPEERYQKYVKDYPNVINRAPDKYIANILGITPVSLSRIRKRLATKKN